MNEGANTHLNLADPVISKASERIDYLDGWRGLAIALVLEGHFVNILPFETGRLGVDLFFCLSGYLMGGILFQQKQPLKKFYKRRISRILPAFIVFVLAMHAFAFIKGLDFSSLEFVSTLLFLRTYIPDSIGIWKSALPIGHIWSLNIEEHCYIFMSLIILFRCFGGREAFVLLISGTLCICIGFVYIKMGSHAPHWGELGTEVAASHLLLAAGYRLLREKLYFQMAGWVPLLFLIIAVGCYSSAVPWWSSKVISPFMLAFCINHLSESYSWFRLLLTTQVLKKIGIWSFSIYLWQQPLYSYKLCFPGGTLSALFLVYLISMFSYYKIEQPCRRWLNKNW